LAAWFCANSPQAATYSFIVWAGDSRHFSHQERLRADVALLLAGRPAPGAPRAVSAAPARPFAPPVPAEAVLKKLDLSAPIAVEGAAPGIRALAFPEPPPGAPFGTRLEPLLTPPRAAAIV